MHKGRLDFSRYALAAAVAGSAGAVHDACADFSSPYALNPPANGTYSGANAAGVFGNWTSSLTFIPDLSGSDALTTNAPISVQFSINNRNNNSQADTWNLTTLAAGSGLVSFDWSLVFTAGPSEQFGYTVNNAFTSLSSGNTNANGSTSFAVNAGDTFGFRLIASYTSNVTVSISNFSAPVPEPSITMLLSSGVLALFLLRETRRRTR